MRCGALETGNWLLAAGYPVPNDAGRRHAFLKFCQLFSNYTAFHKNFPAGISGCRKKRLNNGTFFFDNHYKRWQAILELGFHTISIVRFLWLAYCQS